MSILAGIGTGLQIAGTAFDIFNGFSQSQSSKEAAESALQTAEDNRKYAAALYDQQQKYWALENLQLGYMQEDLEALRPAYEDQVAYQEERLGDYLEQAQIINPMVDQAEVDLVTKLTESEDAIAERYRTQAAADINNSFSQQRSEDMRAMGLAGVNPNSGQTTNYITQAGLTQALGSAAAQTQATRSAEEAFINRSSAAMNFSKSAQMPNYSLSYNNSAIQGAIGATSSAGSTYSGLAQMYNQSAQDSFAGASYLLNNLTSGQLFGAGSSSTGSSTGIGTTVPYTSNIA